MEPLRPSMTTLERAWALEFLRRCPYSVVPLPALEALAGMPTQEPDVQHWDNFDRDLAPIRPRPYVDARKFALDVELPDQAAQPRRELPVPTAEQVRAARAAYTAKQERKQSHA